jgi:hypothetical protein
LTDTIFRPVSPAELIDDAGKLDNVRAELATLCGVLEQRLPASAVIRDWKAQVKHLNEHLWEIEGQIRKCEQAGEFGDRFVGLARGVYLTNDRRAKLKRDIDMRLGSPLLEEKSYSG